MPVRSGSFPAALVVSGVLAALLAGCAVDPYAADPAARQLQAHDAVTACLQRFQALDARIDATGVRDAAAERVDGYPSLRADRYTVLATPEENARRVLAHLERQGFVR